ncbi:MAG: hypothetical protein ACE5EC_10070, partial [Phycisphaerae bacterium]
ERIARAMAPGKIVHGKPPDYFTDPAAADALIRWCLERGVIYLDGRNSIRGKYWEAKFGPEGGENIWVELGRDWKEALAKASGEAIRQFAPLLKGKICS